MGSLVNEEECQTNGFHSSSDPETELSKFKVLKSTDQIKELQTIIRDKETSRSDFKFVADRLIRMVRSGLVSLVSSHCSVIGYCSR